MGIAYIDLKGGFVNWYMANCLEMIRAKVTNSREKKKSNSIVSAIGKSLFYTKIWGNILQQTFQFKHRSRLREPIMMQEAMGRQIYYILFDLCIKGSFVIS